MTSVGLVGMTEYPGFQLENPERMLASFRLARERASSRANAMTIPSGLTEELGADDGINAARQHAARAAEQFVALRSYVDRFAPDVVLVCCEDHDETFPSLVPPLAIFGATSLHLRLGGTSAGPSRWPTRALEVKGHRDAARWLHAQLLTAGFDVAAGYESAGVILPHSLSGVMRYLDWRDEGFPYPVVPMFVNCYGNQWASVRSDPREDLRPEGVIEPWRCFDLGVALADALERSGWRALIVGSSSWSHASLTKAHGYLFPDVEADRRMFRLLEDGRYNDWREVPLETLVAHGQLEMLTWYPLVGAAFQLGATARRLVMLQTYLFNSTKVFTILE